jgi:hypothetical protein
MFSAKISFGGAESKNDTMERGRATGKQKEQQQSPLHITAAAAPTHRSPTSPDKKNTGSVASNTASTSATLTGRNELKQHTLHAAATRCLSPLLGARSAAHHHRLL